MKFNIEDTYDLLREDFYIDLIEEEQSSIWVSRFKDASYNFIIPKISINRLKLKSILDPYKTKGYEFSYYIDKKDLNKHESLPNELLYTDRYIFKEVSSKYKIEERDLVTLDKENFEEFIAIGEICFPDWETREFTQWCLVSPNVLMYGVKEDGKIIAFGGSYSKSGSELVLLMNAGTHPDHRRNGLHHYMIKYRINQNLKNNGLKIFYSNVEEGGASFNSLRKMEFKLGPLFHVYQI